MTVAQFRRRTAVDWLSSPEHQTGGRDLKTQDLAASTDQTLTTISLTEATQENFWAHKAHLDAGRKLQHAYLTKWQIHMRARLAESTTSMLAELADLGFAWRDIARMLNVSVPAIQKWRKGGATTPDNRQRLANLLGACDLIANHHPIADIAQWFEVPLKQGVPVTPIDIWAAGKPLLLFRYAFEPSEPSINAILDRFEPGWREHYQIDFETFLAGDGQLSIRMRDR